MMNVDSSIRRGNLALVFMLILFISASSTTTIASSWHQVSNDHADELKDFYKFLGDDTAILPDLKRDPSLIADADYLALHPELKEKIIYHATKDFAASDAIMSRCVSTAISLLWSEEQIQGKGEKMGAVIKKILKEQNVGA